MNQNEIVNLVIKKSKQNRKGWFGNKDHQFGIQIDGKMYYGKTQSQLARNILTDIKNEK